MMPKFLRRLFRRPASDHTGRTTFHAKLRTLDGIAGIGQDGTVYEYTPDGRIRPVRPGGPRKCPRCMGNPKTTFCGNCGLTHVQPPSALATAGSVTFSVADRTYTCGIDNFRITPTPSPERRNRVTLKWANEPQWRSLRTHSDGPR
jgi:hypothetical protein